MNDLLHTLIDRNDLIPIIAIGGGLIIAFFYVVFSNIAHVMTTRARETTKRELAAYVAEGSMSPEKAVALLTAGDDAENVEKTIQAVVTAFKV